MPNLPVAPTLATANVVRKGNVGAGAETLLNLFLPPGILRNIGDCIFLHGAVQLAANVSAKSGLMQFNGTTVAGRSASDNGAFYDMRAMVYRISATTVMAFGLCNNSGTATQVGTFADIAVADFNAPIEVKVQGQGPAPDDVISRVLRYMYIPVGSVFDF